MGGSVGFHLSGILSLDSRGTDSGYLRLTILMGWAPKERKVSMRGPLRANLQTPVVTLAQIRQSQLASQGALSCLSLLVAIGWGWGYWPGGVGGGETTNLYERRRGPSGEGAPWMWEKGKSSYTATQLTLVACPLNYSEGIFSPTPYHTQESSPGRY